MLGPHSSGRVQRGFRRSNLYAKMPEVQAAALRVAVHRNSPQTLPRRWVAGFVLRNPDLKSGLSEIHDNEGSVMSGHSKWATIKHKKAATDAKRGRVFTRLIRELTIAARIGGGDANSNPRLRTAILAAKNENMPNDNIERAILRGTGQLAGEQYEEVTFEGYGPGGVGILIQVVTTNRNRAVGEMRHLMGKNGGNLAEAGAVGWMFHRKGELSVPKEAASEDKLLDLVLEAGAEDLKDDGSAWYIVTPPDALEGVKDALSKAGITPASAEIGMVPQNYIKLTGYQAQQMLKLVEALEEHDDVQHVYANFDIDESEIQAAVGAN